MNESKLPWTLNPATAGTVATVTSADGKIVLNHIGVRSAVDMNFIVNTCNLHDQLLADLVECGAQRQKAVMELGEARKLTAKMLDQEMERTKLCIQLRDDKANLAKLLRTAEAALALQAPDIGTTASTTKIMAMGEIAHVLNAIEF